MAAGDEEGGGGADGSAVSLDESAATKSRWRIRPYGPLREHQLLPRLARGGKLFFGRLETWKLLLTSRGCKKGLFFERVLLSTPRRHLRSCSQLGGEGTSARSEGRETRDLLRAELEVEDVEVLLVRVRVRGRGLGLGSVVSGQGGGVVAVCGSVVSVRVRVGVRVRVRVRCRGAPRSASGSWSAW